MNRRINVASAAIAHLLLPSVLAAQSPAFEVASVRPHQGNIFRSGPWYVSDPLIRLEGYTIFGLTMDAFNVRDFQLSFGKIPMEDVADTMYDIVARAPGGNAPGIADARLMLQNLLAERFGMKVHRETKEMAVYAMVAGRNASKLKQGVAGEKCAVKTGIAADGRNREEVFTNCTMERLADRIGNLMGQERPVIDQTGLNGVYDFRLRATPDYRSRGGAEPTDISPVAALGALGLRLVSQRAPIVILVIDHVQKPGEN